MKMTTITKVRRSYTGFIFLIFSTIIINPVFAVDETDVNLLKDIQTELLDINLSLKTLKEEFDNFTITTIPPTTTKLTSTSTSTTGSTTTITATTSTADPVPPVRRDEVLFLGYEPSSVDQNAVLKASTDICFPDSTSELCSRLASVLEVLEGVTDEINTGNITDSHLDSLKSSSEELKIIVSDANEDFYGQLKPDVFTEEFTRVENKVKTAIEFVEAKIPKEGPNVLVILMGILGSVILLSFLGVVIYGATINNKQKKSDQRRKINATTAPIQPLAEEGNVNKAFVEEDFPRVSILPTPRFSRQSQHNHHRSNSARSSSVRADSMDRKVYRPSSRSQYDDDPYALEKRSANIKRATPGGLLRYEP